MPFIPLHDENPRILIAKPYVTWGLIALCAAVFVVQLSSGDGLINALGLIPATLMGDAQLSPHHYMVPPAVTLVSYAFLHGGWLHLGGNMLFLWVFGDNIEDAMGHGRFIAFYLVGGVLAGLMQVFVDPMSRVPTVGASGSVAAVLGAYFMLYPRAKVRALIVIFPVNAPAVLLLGIWILFQIFFAIGGGETGVAWWAHIGGFVAGALLIIPLRHNSLPLFGGDNLPSGITLRGAFRRSADDDAQDRRGPWG